MSKQSAKRSLASTDNSPRICGYCGAVNCEHAAGNSSICEYMSGKAEYPAKREAIESVLTIQITHFQKGFLRGMSQKERKEMAGFEYFAETFDKEMTSLMKQIE